MNGQFVNVFKQIDDMIKQYPFIKPFLDTMLSTKEDKGTHSA